MGGTGLGQTLSYEKEAKVPSKALRKPLAAGAGIIQNS